MTSELFPQPPVGQPEDHNSRNTDNIVDRRANQPANARSRESEALTSGDPGGDGNTLNQSGDNAENTASAPAAPAPAPARASNQRNNSLIQPHARFSRALNKGKVTVKFDPPM